MLCACTRTRTHTHTHTSYFWLAYNSHPRLRLFIKASLDPSKEEFANETVQKFSLTIKLKMTWTPTTKRYSWTTTERFLSYNIFCSSAEKKASCSFLLTTLHDKCFLLKPSGEGEVHLSWTFREAEIMPVLSASDLLSAPKRHRDQPEKEPRPTAKNRLRPTAPLQAK